MSEKISALPGKSGPISSADLVAGVQAGVTIQMTVQDIIDAVNTKAMVYRGVADASQADEDAATGTATHLSGDFYRISVAATSPHAFSDIAEDLKVGDFIIYDGTQWDAMIVDDAASAAEIKVLYESNADTNEFSDAEKTKLGGIATSATTNPNAVNSTDFTDIVRLTQAAYDLLTPDANTMYVIVG